MRSVGYHSFINPNFVFILKKKNLRLEVQEYYKSDLDNSKSHILDVNQKLFYFLL